MGVTTKQILYLSGIIFSGIILGIFVAKTQIMGVATIIALPFVIGYLIAIFRNPVLGVYTVLVFSFFVNGVGRYANAGLWGFLLTFFW
jgi:hypothetical protein